MNDEPTSISSRMFLALKFSEEMNCAIGSCLTSHLWIMMTIMCWMWLFALCIYSVTVFGRSNRNPKAKADVFLSVRQFLTLFCLLKQKLCGPYSVSSAHIHPTRLLGLQHPEVKRSDQAIVQHFYLNVFFFILWPLAGCSFKGTTTSKSL